jgi:hypothetical protein
MPRIVLACVPFLVGACLFKANYEGGDLACSDGRCPAGLACHADGRCGPPIDAAARDATDASDASIDARVEALTCADPGIIAGTGGMKTGTTAGRTSRMSASCGGFVNNGPDAVHRITLPAGTMVTVAITGTLKAYVIAGCVEQPSTPVCYGNARATSSVPLTISPAAGDSFIVVDEENPGASGAAYTLTVTVN